MKSLFKQIISDFHSSEIKQGKKREQDISLDTGKIISIIGPRRAGKSFFLYSMMHTLLSSGVPKKRIIYINFEDERLHISGEHLHTLLDAYLELYSDERLQDVYFFFDEIQNIVGWERFIRRIYDSYTTHIFITGSNAKLLSREIATSLRGRNLTFEILPLNFREFLDFKGCTDISVYSTLGRARILNLQEEYLKWGGFPELIDFATDIKILTLQEYFDVMIYNDIIERYQVKDATLLKHFIRLLLQSATKEYSINKIGNTLRSQGFRFDKNILYEFIDHLATIFFSESIAKFEYALTRQTLKKLYVYDNGFLNALSFHFSDNHGKLLENTVFVELFRRFGKDIFFLRNGSETDFIINRREKSIFQVCYQLTPENQEREIAGCVHAMKRYDTSTATIISADQEQEIQRDSLRIRVIPFYRWMLER